MKQFHERNAVIIGSVSALLLLGVLLFALTVTREDLRGGYELTMEFDSANGLRPGDVVLIAGVRAGRVLDIEIVGEHVEATALMDGGIEVPRQARAEISLRTLVGRRSITIDTGEDFSRLLADGDRVRLDQTTVGIDVPTFGDTAEELLSEIDSEAFNQFLVSLTDLTRDQRDEVARLIEAGTRLTGIINDQETEIRTLLRELSSLTATVNSRDEELIGIIDDLDVALANLAARREEVRRLFRETAFASGETADLVRDTRDELDSILDEVHLDLAIVSRHQVDFAEALAYLGDALHGFASISYAGEVPVPWGHVFVSGLGSAGVDVLAACGGLIDQQLDALLGPDPRSCVEQDQDTFPDDVERPPQGPIPPLDDLLPDLPLRVVEPELEIDAGLRQLLDALGPAT